MRSAAIVIAACVHAFLQQRYELTETDRWEKAAAVDPAAPEGQLAAAREALAAGENRRAYNLADAWIDRHKQHPAAAEAYLIRGDALNAQGDHYEALFDYEYVARAFPASETFVIALQRELEIATLFARGTKRKFLGMRIMDGGDVAEEALIRIQERLPGSHLAEQAAMELADYYFGRRKMELAVEMYSIFLENHPDSDQVTKAKTRLIWAHLATFKGPGFDASGLREARARLQELMVTEPATAQEVGAEALLTRIDESNARKLLLTAEWYQKRGDPVAAELMIRKLVLRYPRTIATADALRLMNDILPRLPLSVVREAPDYRAFQEAILGAGPEEAESAP